MLWLGSNLSIKLPSTGAQQRPLEFDLTHLHLFVHDFLHPHFNSSWHALASSGRVVQFWVHVASSVSLCPAHICGGGSSGVPLSDWSQMCPAWYAALFTFCSSACSIGRMLSILRFWVNTWFLALFTLLTGWALIQENNNSFQLL